MHAARSRNGMLCVLAWARECGKQRAQHNMYTQTLATHGQSLSAIKTVLMN